MAVSKGLTKLEAYTKTNDELKLFLSLVNS